MKFLALIQTNYVISLLKELHPTFTFEIVTMTTLGDRILNVSLPKIGEKSLFTKDLEEALANGSVDMVVHSLKDLPTTLPDGMAIGAVLKREDPNDALVLREDYKNYTLATLPAGSIIGTSSLRRTAQLSRGYPHLKVVDIRGNLNTRLKKLDHHYHLKMNQTNGCTKAEDNNDDVTYPNYAALILARAGLVRMGWQNRISEVLASNEVLYAVGQGALAIECRANNDKILEMLAPLNDKLTYCKILSERSFLKTLGGGCSTPVAICTSFELNSNKSKRKLEITGAVWSLDGKKKIQESVEHEFDSSTITEDECSKTKPLKHKLNGDNDLSIVDEINSIKKVCPGLKSDTENGNGTTESSKTIQVKCPYYDNCLIQMPASEDLSQKQVDPNVNEVTSTYDKILYRKAMKEAEPVEVENLINIHGQLFWACPNVENCSARMKSKGNNTINENAPTNNFKEILVKIHMRKSLDINKCPFMTNQIVACKAQNEIINAFETQPLVRSERAKNCLFLNTCEKNGNTSAADVKLYCGLTKHFSIAEDVIIKCEEIGKELAQTLIGRGALDIMKAAQDTIQKPPKEIMPHNIPLGDDFQGVCPVISHENN